MAVELGLVDGALRVDVSDNGPGIGSRGAAADLPVPPRRLTERPTGTDLGLPICREIVTYLGGELWVESEGRGATFSFTLPLTDAPVGAEAEGLMASRVLIVDDEPNIVTPIEFLARSAATRRASRATATRR